MTDKLPTNMADTLRARAADAGQRFYANDNISELYHSDAERIVHQCEVEAAVEALLKALVIDTDNDHNTADTAKRVAKMFLQETMGGRYKPMPDATFFPNASELEGLYVVGPITINSMCSHHLVPFVGKCWIGVVPSEHVIGLSKFNRIAQHFASRPQIQEELTVQVADTIEELIKPEAMGVIIKAHHMCCSTRGVKDADTEMTTSVMRGLMMESSSLRQEFLTFVMQSK